MSRDSDSDFDAIGARESSGASGVTLGDCSFGTHGCLSVDAGTDVVK